MKKKNAITFKIHRADCQCILADMENMRLKQEEYSVIFELGVKTDLNSVLEFLRSQHKGANIIAIKSVNVSECVYSIPYSVAMAYGKVDDWKILDDCYNWFTSSESEENTNV